MRSLHGVDAHILFYPPTRVRLLLVGRISIGSCSPAVRRIMGGWAAPFGEALVGWAAPFGEALAAMPPIPPFAVKSKISQNGVQRVPLR